MKFIFENLSDILKSKSSDQIASDFKNQTGATYYSIEETLLKLKEYDIEIEYDSVSKDFYVVGYDIKHQTSAHSNIKSNMFSVINKDIAEKMIMFLYDNVDFWNDKVRFTYEKGWHNIRLKHVDALKLLNKLENQNKLVNENFNHINIVLNEDIKNILKPKNEDDIDEESLNTFKETTGVSFAQYKQYAKELTDLGIIITNFYSNRTNSMTIKTFKVMCNNWQVGTCPTQKHALALIATHKQYSIDNSSYEISEDTEYLNVNKIKKLILKLRMNISHNPKFTNNYFNIQNKYDSDEYNKWYNDNYE